jgi:RNA polymerase sigma-70 factor (sigma-E family)
VTSLTTTGSDLVVEDQFTELFLAHAGRLVRLAALLGDLDPEDAAAEAFCKFYKARHRLRTDDRLVGYLTRILVNEVRDRQRRRSVERRDAHLVAVPDAVGPASNLGEHDLVVRALATLPQRQREVLVLRYWLDLPIAGIAEVMGIRAGTVKSQLSRGLDRLQETLAETEGARS